MKERIKRPKFDHGKAGKLELVKTKVPMAEIKSHVDDRTKPFNAPKREVKD